MSWLYVKKNVSDFRLYSLFPLWTVTAGFCLPGRCTGLLSVVSSGASSCPTIHAHVEGLSVLAAFSLLHLFCLLHKVKTVIFVLMNYLFSEVSLCLSRAFPVCMCVCVGVLKHANWFKMKLICWFIYLNMNPFQGLSHQAWLSLFI